MWTRVLIWIAKRVDRIDGELAGNIDREHYPHWSREHLSCVNPRKCGVCGGEVCDGEPVDYLPPL